jgi:hypothetical protein
MDGILTTCNYNSLQRYRYFIHIAYHNGMQLVFSIRSVFTSPLVMASNVKRSSTFGFPNSLSASVTTVLSYFPQNDYFLKKTHYKLTFLWLSRIRFVHKLSLCPKVKVKVKVILPPTVSRPVHLGPATNFSFSLKFSLDSCKFVIF